MSGVAFMRGSTVHHTIKLIFAFYVRKNCSGKSVFILTAWCLLCLYFMFCLSVCVSFSLVSSP